MAPPRKPGRPAKEPVNASRGSGRAAPASAAATEPFYSNIRDAAAPAPRAIHETRFTEEVRSAALPLEQGGTVDREVGERLAMDVGHSRSDYEAEVARIRSIRKPLGAYAQKLDLPKRPGYHRHWFNDVAGRVDEAEANGWAHIQGRDGKPMARCVGSGRDKGALYAYAMEIPEVFWQEDQNARNAMAAEKMAGLKRNPFQAAPGQTKPADKGKFYDPVESGSGPLSITKG